MSDGPDGAVGTSSGDAMETSRDEPTDAESATVAERYESSVLPTHPVFYALLVLGGVLIWIGAGPASGEPTGLYGLVGISLILGAVLSYGAFLLWHAVD